MSWEVKAMPVNDQKAPSDYLCMSYVSLDMSVVQLISRKKPQQLFKSFLHCRFNPALGCPFRIHFDFCISPQLYNCKIEFTNLHIVLTTVMH